MWTIGYKGHYIHGNFALTECQMQICKPDGGFKLRLCKSVRAAKCAITKYLKHESKT